VWGKGGLTLKTEGAGGKAFQKPTEMLKGNGIGGERGGAGRGNFKCPARKKGGREKKDTGRSLNAKERNPQREGGKKRAVYRVTKKIRTAS